MPTQVMDILKVDALARQKNSKRHFLEDISKSFQEVTPMNQYICLKFSAFVHLMFAQI